MLSENTIALIQSTAPVLEKRGTEITTRFYQLLFTNHPELLNLFNHTNQKLGRQQGALAGAVYAAALHIDRLEAILPAVKQIAHKHRSLGVKPEHYPIVGQNLLAAIKDVLGDEATEPLLGAWSDAYQVIAEAFIGVEQEMYAQSEGQPGGWKDFRPFVVRRKVFESDVIASFYLDPQDGGALAGFEPGQYVSVKLEIPGEKHIHIRQYSLSDAPGKPYYRISVKREDSTKWGPEGKVSVYLHEHIHEGDVLWLSAPAGDFTLDTNDHRPVVLLSGGVGLTPMISMLNVLAQSKEERPTTYIHAALNGRTHAMKDHVLQLEKEMPHVTAYFCYEQPLEEDRRSKAFHKEGYIDKAWLQHIMPKEEANYYICGPIPFMKEMYSLLCELGVPDSSIRYEFFGPSGTLSE